MYPWGFGRRMRFPHGEFVLLANLPSSPYCSSPANLCLVSHQMQEQDMTPSSKTRRPTSPHPIVERVYAPDRDFQTGCPSPSSLTTSAGGSFARQTASVFHGSGCSQIPIAGRRARWMRHLRVVCLAAPYALGKCRRRWLASRGLSRTRAAARSLRCTTSLSARWQRR